MQAPCEVKLRSGNGWTPAVLTTDHAASIDGVPVVTIGGEPITPAEVESVRITAKCPIDLFDRAVDNGFHVLGRPGGIECVVCLPGITEGEVGTLSTVSGDTRATIRIDGKTIAPHEVETIFVGRNCPPKLFDAAIDAGFHVLGGPDPDETEGEDND